MKLDRNKLKATVRHVTDLLANRDYDTLEQFTHQRRLSAEQLATAISEYGGTVVPLPDHALERAEAFGTESGQACWSTVDLFTAEEGRSDLTLELTLRQSDTDLYNVEIDNLHVM